MFDLGFLQGNQQKHNLLFLTFENSVVLNILAVGAVKLRQMVEWKPVVTHPEYFQAAKL